MTIAEVLSTKGALTTVAKDGIGNALSALEAGLAAVWNAEDPSDALAPVAKSLGEAAEFGKAAREEPRFSAAPWNYALLTDLHAQATLLDLDVKLIRAATTGADGETAEVFKVLGKVPECEQMKKDLLETLKHAHDLSTELLAHERGEFKKMSDLQAMEGVDELDGYDEAIKKINSVAGFGFPDQGNLPASIEDDLCVQLSIVFLLLNAGLQHTAGIIKSAVRNS